MPASCTRLPLPVDWPYSVAEQVVNGEYWPNPEPLYYIEELIDDDKTRWRELADWAGSEYAQTCTIKLRMATFDCAMWDWRRTFVVVYRGRNFNLGLPKLQPFRRDVWDCIRRSADGPFPVDPVTEFYCNQLPNGWFSDELAIYQDGCPEHPDGHEFLRLQWPYGAMYTHRVQLHPDFRRPLFDDEMQALLQSNLDEWLEQQEQLFDQNYWGEKNYESRYDGRAGQWVGTDLNTVNYWSAHKSFDITEFVPPPRYTLAHNRLPPPDRTGKFDWTQKGITW